MPESNTSQYPWEENLDAVAEFEAALAVGEKGGDPGYLDKPGDELTIKFSKKLVSAPFMSKAGVELVRISIPNQDPEDKSSWKTFVLRSNQVHENKYGKGMWAKLPADGQTTVSKSIATIHADGTKSYHDERKTVTNATLKSMVEYYREHPRESVVGQIRSEKAREPESKKEADRTPTKKNPAKEAAR